MTGTLRGGVDLGPAELHADRRTGDIVGRYRTAADGFVDEGLDVAAEHLAGARRAAAAARDIHRAGQAERCERIGVRTGDAQIARGAGVQGDRTAGIDRRLVRRNRAGDAVDGGEQIADGGRGKIQIGGVRRGAGGSAGA